MIDGVIEEVCSLRARGAEVTLEVHALREPKKEGGDEV